MKILRLLFALLCILGVLGSGLFVWYRIAENTPEGLRARADEDYYHGRHREALLRYRKLLTKDPQNAHAFRRIGIIWIERGAPLRAIPFLEQALRVEPDDVRTRRKWAEVMMSIGDLREAREETLKILELAPTDPDGLLILADTSVTKAQIAEAWDALQPLDPATDPFYHLAAGALFAREGKEEEVQAALERAREIAPESPEVRHAFAAYHRSMGNQEECLAILEEAYRGDGVRPEDQLRYAEALAGAGRSDEAMQILWDLAAEREDFLPARLTIADLLARDDKFDAALENLESVRRIDYVNLEGRSIEARIHLARGSPAKAVTAYETAKLAFPQAPLIKFGLATCYLRNGQDAMARAMLDAAMEMAPELSGDHADVVVKLADLELRSGNPATASKWLALLAFSRPDLRQAQILLARAHAAEGSLEDAADVFRASIEKQPQSPLGHFMLGQIFKLQNKAGEAIRSLETAQSLAPDDLIITAELVELDLLQQDFATAHRRVRHYLDQASPALGAWILEGGVFSAEKRWDQAEAAYQKALDLDPASLAVYDRLIDNHLRAGDPAKAIARLEAVAKERPDSIQHRMSLGLLLAQQSEFERAAANYRKLLADAPEFMPAFNNLARLYAVHLGNLAEAEPIARKARQLDKEHPAVADTLGWILVRLGGEERLQEGLRLLKQAAAELPDEPELQYHLGIALSRTGARRVARQALERAAAAGDDFPGKDEASRVLVALEGASPSGKSPAELEELRENAPFNLPVRLQLGQLYLSRGESAKALAVYQEVLELDNRNRAALKALAKLEHSAHPQQARGYAWRAWDADPSDLEAAALQGYWVYQDRRFAHAYSILRPGARTGRDPAVMAMFANAAFNIGKIAEARERMQEIPAEAPQHAEAQTFLTLTAKPADADALAAMEGAADAILEANPTSVPAVVVRAARLERSGVPKAAILQYEYLHQYYPDFQPAAIRLADLYADTPGRLDDAKDLAIKTLFKILNKGGDSSPALDRVLGEILARKGEAAPAITRLERAQETIPLDAEGLFFLGKSYLEAGQKTNGRQTLEAALKAGLDQELAAVARELLFPGQDQAAKALAAVEGASMPGKSPAQPEDLREKALAAVEGAPMPGKSPAQPEDLREKAPLDLPAHLQLAQLHLSQGESAKALAVYQEALKLDGQNLAVLKALAKLAHSAHPEQARAYARRAWEADPSDSEAAALEGYWACQDRRFAQAYKILRPGARAGRDPAVMARFANAAFLIGKIEEARDMMRKIPAEAPEHAEAQTFLTLTTEPADADARTAMELAADAALEADPTDVPAVVVRAARLERSGAAKAAVPQYEYLHQYYPDFHPATIRLAALYAATPGRLADAEKLAFEALEKVGNTPALDRVLGEILARKDKAAPAITHLERARESSPLDADGLVFLGKSYVETGQQTKALAVYQEALKLDAQNLAALKALAKLAHSAHPEQARAYARRAWEADPSDSEAAALHGYWACRERRFAHAYAILRPGAGAGRDPAVMARFANAAFLIGKIGEARDMMRKIPAEAPEHAEAQTFLTLTANPADADARTALRLAADAALKANPTYVPAVVVRAAHLERSGGPKAAIAQYEYLHQYYPDFHPATIRLAALYAVTPGRLDDAEKLVFEALEQIGNTPASDRVLGEILARNNKAGTAITFLERAQKTSPLDAHGLFLLGNSYLKTEQHTKGRHTLEAALKAGLDQKLATTARELLKAE